MRRYKLSPGSNFQVAVDGKRFRRIINRLPELKQLAQDDGDFSFQPTDEDGHFAKNLKSGVVIDIHNKTNHSS